MRQIQAGHDCALRKYLPNADYEPQQIVDAFPLVPDQYKSKVLVITNNEQDWGWSRRPNESARDWIFRGRDKTLDVCRRFYQLGYRRFTFLNFSMGTFDVTDPETCLAVGDAYRDLYNSQLLDGNPVEWWVDMHNYVPDPTWLTPDRTLPGTVAHAAAPALDYSVPAGEGIVKRESRVSRDGEPYVMTWVEPASPFRAEPMEAAVAATSRILQPWDWFLTRWRFLFWPEYHIGFDPAIRRIRPSETGFDKGGTGGAPAQGLTTKQVYDSGMRMLQLLYEPLDMGNGVTAPSPYGGGTWFTTSTHEWLGYSIAYVVGDQSIPIANWVLPPD